MFLEFLSVAILAGGYVSEKVSNANIDRKNRQYDISSGHAARFGSDAWLFRGKTTIPQIVQTIVAYNVKVPFTQEELNYIKRRVENFEQPLFRRDVLTRYNEQTGENLHYPFKVSR